MIIRRKGALVWAGLAALALFSAIFTFLAERGLWPALPPGALHDSDLWAGLIGAALLLILLLRGGRSGAELEDPTRGSRDAETRGQLH